MPLENARIDQFPDYTPADINPNDYLAIRDMTNLVTCRIKANRVTQTAPPSTSYKWISTFSYAVDAIVESGGKWWKSLVGSNLGHVPTEGAGFWTEVSISASGFVYWAAGVFTQAEVIVLHPLDQFVQLFRLVNPTRPFSSGPSFEAEYAAGTWELMSERGYVGISKVAHGFALNDVLTYKSGAWNKFTTGDKPIAIVRQVVSADLVIVVLLGARLKGLSGLTAGSVYYAQADATVSTTVSDNAIFLAVSATEAILLAGSGGAVAVQDQYVVASIPARTTLSTGWGVDETGWIVHVVNAYKDFPSAGQGDPTVNTNPCYAGYIWDGSAFKKIYEFEGLDIAFNKFSIVTQNITGSVTIDLSAGNMFILTLTGNVTSFSYSNEEAGREYVFIFLKDTSEKTLAWATGKYRFPFGNAPVLTNPTTNGTSSPARSVDIMTALCYATGRLNIVQSPDFIEN